MISNKDKNEIYITGSSQYLLLDLIDNLESNVPNIKVEIKGTKVKKALDIIIKEYLALKTFARKNNFFAIISKKIYEIPNFVKKTFKFLGTLKRRFITKAYKKLKKNVLSRFYPKRIIKNLIVNIKKRIELYRPTPIETESFKQTLILKQAIFKFKLGLGIFNFKRRLIRTRLRHVFYTYDYKYDFEGV